jgi:hypothetical protein
MSVLQLLDQDLNQDLDQNLDPNQDLDQDLDQHLILEKLLVFKIIWICSNTVTVTMTV